MYGNPYQPYQPWNQWQGQQPYPPQPQPQYQYNQTVTRQEFEELRSGYDRLAQQLAALQQGGNPVNLPSQGQPGGTPVPPTGGGGWQDNPVTAGPSTQAGYQQPAQPPIA